MTDNKNTKNASSIWGGRFDGGVSSVMERINASIDFDRELYHQDIAGSKAHAAMLVKTGIISQDDGDAIAQGLDQIADEISQGQFEFSAALEDIHMNIETRLAELTGDAAKDYTPPGRETIKSPLICGFGCVMPLIRLMLISKPCKPALLTKPKPTLPRLCPAIPICKPPSLLPLAITCWPMLKCWGVTAADLPMPEHGLMNLL